MDQGRTAQQDALAASGVDPKKSYLDHHRLTGTNVTVPGYAWPLVACRDGAALVVTELDRLARSVPDARDIVDELIPAAGVRQHRRIDPRPHRSGRPVSPPAWPKRTASLVVGRCPPSLSEAGCGVTHPVVAGAHRPQHGCGRCGVRRGNRFVGLSGPSAQSAHDAERNAEGPGGHLGAARSFRKAAGGFRFSGLRAPQTFDSSRSRAWGVRTAECRRGPITVVGGGP